MIKSKDAAINDIEEIVPTVFQESNGHLMPYTDVSMERVFFITKCMPGNVRGEHAHIETTQTFICLKGAVTLELNDGRDSKTIKIEEGGKIIKVPPGIWASQKYWSYEGVLAVLCDSIYKAGDYIRNFDQFKEFKGV